MRPVDVGIDATQVLCTLGSGRVRAVFDRAIYLVVPGGLVVLVPTDAPRGPLHVRVETLPDIGPECLVWVDRHRLRIGDHCILLDAPIWSPQLPPAASLARARGGARCWLPDLGPALDVGTVGRAELGAAAVTALRRGDVGTFAAEVGGRGPGLTPAGDDMMAGVLLVARAMWGASGMAAWTHVQRKHLARTNDIASAFLTCAAQGRCIEPAHDLLHGLARGDHGAVSAAAERLCHFGSSSGAALAYGLRAALLELPPAPGP
ncbi:DUF2877 domain-containing protein [Terrabacter sp. GCM10028922]|uniref:DUF2877 domain-containing protein n=1 Tax=Terrabacter sp. GCM10028922 TaxID=3273428 RepID=UPI00361EA6C2